MALELTQPLTEMRTRNISWGKGDRCVGLITLPRSCADSASWNPQVLPKPVTGLLYLFNLTRTAGDYSINKTKQS
jgi:hypothetical protein